MKLLLLLDPLGRMAWSEDIAARTIHGDVVIVLDTTGPVRNECLNPLIQLTVINVKEGGGNDANHFVVEVSACRTQEFRPSRNMVVEWAS